MKQRSARTKTAAKAELKELLRDLDDGVTEAAKYTVADAVEDFLTHGQHGRSKNTVKNRRTLAETHIVAQLGARKLRELTAQEVDGWLADRAKVVSTSTLQRIKSILRRAIARAQAREKVRRNVVLLCETPTGLGGRPSKALTLGQAQAFLQAAEGSPLRAYFIVSLLTGARTEELRPLTWSHVDLDGDLEADPPVKPHIMVWRSVREDGDTKTQKSRRSLALPVRCVEVLRTHWKHQAEQRRRAGKNWVENDLVFASLVGTELNPSNVRREFRRVTAEAGLEAGEWTPRELRHSFVSLLSDSGVPVEKISLLVGHKGSHVTELVYRKQLRPVVEEGATAMDKIFRSKDA
ncbi:integrase [Pseudonocardia eucalypti]|uniref:site-specific integrase n=1 Tax=Pseudonocardia eucalypti TaxID=648755 RepID=UPI001826121A|nr:integrase [Pseudonocardia eucalypti]